MRIVIFGTALLMTIFGMNPGRADIYVWLDAQGVTHYTNSPPPDGATIVERRPEAAHDAESHHRRLAADQESFRAYREAEAQRAREARELELLRTQQAAQQDAAQAARRAEAAAEQAAAAAEKARNTSSGYIVLPPGYRPHRPKPYPPPRHPSRPPRPNPRPNSGTSRRPLYPSGHPMP